MSENAVPVTPDAVGGPHYRKEIVYDRETRDYAMYLDGELVGFARTYHEAEVTLDQLIFELISGQYFQAPQIAERREPVFVAVCAVCEEAVPEGVVTDFGADTVVCTTCAARLDADDDGPATNATAGPGALGVATPAAHLTTNTLFVRVPQHDLRPPTDALTADAWWCGAGHVFWADPGVLPLSCPRCDGLSSAPAALAAPACANCAGPHHIQRCPEVVAVRQGMGFWEDYIERRAAFLERVRCAPPQKCAGMAEAVAAYLTRMGGELTAAAVLHCWAREIAA
jgi:hypothetical protein